MRRQSALLRDDRLPFLVEQLDTLIGAGDDPSTAEVDVDSGDAVHVHVWAPAVATGRGDGHVRRRDDMAVENGADHRLAHDAATEERDPVLRHHESMRR